MNCFIISFINSLHISGMYNDGSEVENCFYNIWTESHKKLDKNHISVGKQIFPILHLDGNI